MEHVLIVTSLLEQNGATVKVKMCSLWRKNWEKNYIVWPGKIELPSHAVNLIGNLENLTIVI